MASTTPQPILSPPEFIFMPSDVRLKITYKDAPAYSHVSSRVMAQASPVWKNFLFPPWFNDETTSINTIDDDQISTDLTKPRLKPVHELDFTEDCTEALLVLLCVAHSKFEDVIAMLFE
jgi:hypothetical protein